MRTAWICTQCSAGSTGSFAEILRREHEQWTAHRTMEFYVHDGIDIPSPGEGVPQLDMALTGAPGGEQPGEGDLPKRKEPEPGSFEWWPQVFRAAGLAASHHCKGGKTRPYPAVLCSSGCGNESDIHDSADSEPT